MPFIRHPNSDELYEKIVYEVLSDRYDGVIPHSGGIIIDRATGDLYLDLRLQLTVDAQTELEIINPEEEYKKTKEYYLGLVEENRELAKKRREFDLKLRDFVREYNKKLVYGNQT